MGAQSVHHWLSARVTQRRSRTNNSKHGCTSRGLRCDCALGGRLLFDGRLQYRRGERRCEFEGFVSVGLGKGNRRQAKESGASALDKAKDAGGDLAAAAKKHGGSALDKAKDAGSVIKDKAKDAGSAIKDHAGNAAGKVKDAASSAGGAVKETAGSAAGKVKDTASSATSRRLLDAKTPTVFA